MALGSQFPSRSSVVAPILLLAVLIGAGGLGISFYFGPSGHAAVPNLDTLLFQQYGRAMAEGHPYRFNPADPPSTGSTSHLVPAVLAVFYRAGLRGDALTTASLFLNFAAWLASLALIYAIARRLDRRAAALATLLCALSGQTFISFFLLNDIGPFTVLALGAFAAALNGRAAWLCLALILASLCRPEGLILSGMLVVISLLSRHQAEFRLKPGQRTSLRPPAFLIAGLCGLAAFAGVFALNRALTGQFQFQSVHNKSVFAAAGLAGGLHQFTTNLGQFIIQGLFNLNHPTRMFYSFPILGGVLGLLGIASRMRRRSSIAPLELWFGLAALASAAPIAASGWSGIQYDKYWTWFLPVWTVYMAMGVGEAARVLMRNAECGMRNEEKSVTQRAAKEPQRFAKKKTVFLFLAVLLVGWQAAGMAHFMAAYRQDCALVAPIISFTKKVREILPAGARVGCRGASGLAYYLDGHPVKNIDGIGAPQYLSPEDPCQAVDLLRHRRDLRFDYWLLSGPDTEQWFKPLVGAQVAAAPPVFGGQVAFTLHKTTWTSLDNTTLPLSTLSTSSTASASSIALSDSLDVGYALDEARCGYETFTRIAGARIGLFTAHGNLAQRPLTEAGRVLIGSETFRLSVKPGRAARLVLRGALAGEAPVLIPPEGKAKSQSFEFVAPLTLNVFVDEKSAGQWEIAPAPGESFFEAIFELPAALLDSEHPTFTIGGDHIAFGYWLYQ